MYPPGDRETTDFTHLDMVILFIEEEVEEEVEEWLQERQMERPNGDLEEINGQNNKLVNQLDRKIPPNVERRDDTERHNNTNISPQLPLLPQRKDYLLTGAVKALQEKELINKFNWLEV